MPRQAPNQKSNPKHKKQKTQPKNKANLLVIKLIKYWKESNDAALKVFQAQCLSYEQYFLNTCLFAYFFV
jgi:hypothetical protein